MPDEKEKEQPQEASPKEEKATEKAETEAPKKEEEKTSKKEAAKEEKTEKPKKAPKKKRSKRRSITEANVHIQASYNNTIITVTEANGDVVSWATAGSAGFKGARKATPYAAQIAAESALQKAKIFGLERAHVFVKGVGSGREQAMRGITANQVEILSITDVTSMPHNGCRKKKRRRV